MSETNMKSLFIFFILFVGCTCLNYGVLGTGLFSFTIYACLMVIGSSS